MPKLFDIHSHINFNAFKDDGDEVIKRTVEADVWTILVGSQYDTSKRAVAYAEKYKKGIYAAVGLHPFHLIEQKIDLNKENGVDDTAHQGNRVLSSFKTRAEKFDFEKYLDLANSSAKVAAIGECGLDYCKTQSSKLKAQNYNLKLKTDKKIKKLQIETFERQIELALKINKPMMIHCRDSHSETINILKKFKGAAGAKLRGDIHFFTGTYEEAKKYFDLGFSISFTGVITFTRDYDEIIKKSPLEKIMIETDSPYVAPVPYRGKRNEPIYVQEVCRRLAEIKNISFEKTAEATTKNALKMFGIEKI